MASGERPRPSSITDLPLDILVLVVPYLDVRSFLALCSSCKAFYQDSIRLDPVYWSYVTRSTFRVPNQPVVQHNGALWQKLYRRLQTQSRVFTWGAAGQGRLGHSIFIRNALGPGQMDLTNIPGIIADLQCGGWSTTILTSKGSLHTAGVLNGETELVTRQTGNSGPQRLRFPVRVPYSSWSISYEEPTISIRQFSAGRSHILGLSDSGRIWSWYSAEKPALHVKFLDVDLTEASSQQSSPANQPLFGRVKKVVAGWSRSSAYVYGIGIVVWDIVSRRPGENEADTVLVMQTAEMPRTGYQRPKGAAKESEEQRALGAEVGVVLNYIILEHFVVFVTDIGRVFCGKFGDHNQVPEVIELQALRNESDTPTDVQGSFRRFAVFKNREVITANQDYLEACWRVRHEVHANNADIPGLQKIPALQKGDVISVAFGDYHFLALHSNGRITSYGKELRHCGALGLSGRYLRGFNRVFGDRQLVPHAYTHGREVWFQREKFLWLEFLESGGTDPDEAAERWHWVESGPSVAGEVSEWIEQEARDWDRNLDIKDDDGLGAHFALSVSAAGWHSGALVLVNQELEDKGARYVWTDQSYPRLRLSDGREMPGTVPFHEWKYGRPEWRLDINVDEI
ncbi:RCC1/BLIP-II [Westerdykella ornata]|uniref:RCC1/BLIP-II n=1 Tax=Westerdykella ornata TaxID=318751 RepID=A0A6A6JAM9_WESOR|nr:RCC1/BLIP-II [Westerdykella ornata]KAF2272676.1 RCC1/BLIP-II [Westerdykella ornata]